MDKNLQNLFLWLLSRYCVLATKNANRPPYSRHFEFERLILSTSGINETGLSPLMSDRRSEEEQESSTVKGFYSSCFAEAAQSEGRRTSGIKYANAYAKDIFGSGVKMDFCLTTCDHMCTHLN